MANLIDHDAIGELERPGDTDRVSKRELVERNTKLRSMCSQLLVELFVENANHARFRDITPAHREILVKTKLQMGFNRG